MSIATDEASQKYPETTDADDPMCKYVEAIEGYPTAKRQGYVAGRTAEPTFAEADELVNELDDLGIPLRIDEALKILKALRKAVTE
jgi:hypothetical protein